jgi:hypothetical protein
MNQSRQNLGWRAERWGENGNLVLKQRCSEGIHPAGQSDQDVARVVSCLLRAMK